MRITDQEKRTIQEAVKSFDPVARVYLFGSRADDHELGGDIDILVFSDRITFKQKLKIKARIFEEIEEQKMDLIIASDSSDPFVRMALQDSVELV